MIEVYPGLFVGSRMDYETLVAGQDGWAIVHACRSYHRIAAGYRILSVTKGHPDYLVARRENRLMLCLLDLPIAVPIQKEMIGRTLETTRALPDSRALIAVPAWSVSRQ